MYERHGLIPSDYTERPVYQTEHSLDLQCALDADTSMIHDMLSLPASDNGSALQFAESINGGGIRIVREFSYHHAVHKEVVSLQVEYETRPIYKSETYSITIDVYPESSYTTDAGIKTSYLLHSNSEHITSSYVRSINLEQGGYYKDRRMTVYDAQQLFNELTEFSIRACHSVETE